MSEPQSASSPPSAGSSPVSIDSSRKQASSHKPLSDTSPVLIETNRSHADNPHSPNIISDEETKKAELREKIASLKKELRMTDAQIIKRVEDVYDLLMDEKRLEIIDYRWLVDMHLEMTSIKELISCERDLLHLLIWNMHDTVLKTRSKLDESIKEYRAASKKMDVSTVLLNATRNMCLSYLKKDCKKFNHFNSGHELDITSDTMHESYSDMEKGYHDLLHAETDTGDAKKDLARINQYRNRLADIHNDVKKEYRQLFYIDESRDVTSRFVRDNLLMIEDDIEDLDDIDSHELLDKENPWA